MARPGDDMPAVVVGRGHMRVSQADREHVIGALKAAFAAGQLAKDEFDLRMDRTLASRTYADLAAAADRTVGLTVGLTAGPPRIRSLRRAENAVAWAVCGLIVAAILTVVIVPSGTTKSVVVVTAVVTYAAFWLLAGIMVLAARHRPHDQVRLGAAGHRLRQRRLRRFVG